ncbi:glycerophosphodiester phosphodiesterase family protein [Pedobacter sp. KR3-3]|uniref:Glycerophosphodiester phosphodiesterase family protein n=1 Tax=Pedobacter albus TaxID=3113905 RepID=A0ABU7I6B3_9SPHI|nr:glycerophosphodiester phosphodiesterase family protein [Pedobacter sp. KR3-3]MEE1945001.1 glycerophosphodiester phosphodiesterase family protein [Pedobacter sp. KR3-3]
MKKIYLVLASVLVVCLSFVGPAKHFYLSFRNADELRNFLNRKTSGYPLISAHRGGPMAGFPENAIETFENATTYQPVIIEFDVALSKDSALVIMHDDKLDRTSTGTGLIGNYTYAELQKFRLKDDNGKETSFKIPTLDQVLTWGKNKVLFTIDLKKGVPYAKIIASVRKTKSESNVIIITYNANQAAEVHRLAPDLMISASARGIADIERLNQMGVPNDRIVAFVGTSAPDKAVYEYLHSKGITCILGTMGNLDKSAIANPNQKVYEKLVANGADILSSDELAFAGKQLDNYRAEKKLKFANLTIK